MSLRALAPVELRALPAADAQDPVAAAQGVRGPRRHMAPQGSLLAPGLRPVYRLLPWRCVDRTIAAMPGSHRQEWPEPRLRPPRPSGLTPRITQQTDARPPSEQRDSSCPRQSPSPRPQEGDVLFNIEEKVFPDIQANPGEKAFVFIHTVPFEGSVGLVNLLTATRLVRKGFEVTIVLYGPGVLLAARHRGYPSVGSEGFPGNLASTASSRRSSTRARRSTPAGSPWAPCTACARTT